MAVSTNQSITVSGTVGSFIAACDAGLVTGLGWTKPYSGTNQAVYRMPSGSNQRYLFVDDTSALTASVRAYESMSAINTGTGPFPTVAQVAGAGMTVTKSDTASAATRPAIFHSNGKFVHIFIGSSTVAWATGQWLAFGDFESEKAGDAYNTLVMGPSQAVTTLSITTGTITDHYVARNHTQAGSSQAVGKVFDYSRSAGGSTVNGAIAYPSQITGRIRLCPLWINDPSAVDVRGLLPGVWCFMHTPNRARPHGDTEAGAGALSGRTFQWVNVGTGNSIVIETSNTW